MSKRILVPVDGSPRSTDALEFATTEWPDATLVLLNVIDPVESGYSGSALPTGSEAWYERAREEATETLDELAEAIGVEVEREIVVGRPAASIVEAAEEDDVDHIVMGSHGRSGVRRVILGSVAEHVVREAPVPVTIVR